MAELDLTAVTASDGRDLLAAAETNWSRPVPHCPGWDAAELVGHMGAILAWMAAIIATGERVSRRDREIPPPGHAALASWYSAHLDRTLEILTTTPADSPAWTFSSLGEHRAGWWRRRLAVELAIHRWDAQHAVADTTIEGTRSDLLLWLTNRGPAPSIRVAGQPSVAAAWAQLRR